MSRSSLGVLEFFSVDGGFSPRTLRPVSSRPSEETVRESFRRFSLIAWLIGVPWCSEGGVRREVCLADRVLVRERWPLDRNAEEFGVLCELKGVDNALLASVSKNDSQFRGSRDLPNDLSFSSELGGVPRTTALALLRRPPSLGLRAENMEMRFLDGDGSPLARMTAFPSADMEIRSEFRPLGGDGVNSSSLRTMASPSNDSDILNDGGDFGVFNPAGTDSAAAPPRSDPARFLLADICRSSLLDASLGVCTACGSACWLDSGHSDVATLVCELPPSCSSSLSTPSDANESPSGSAGVRA